MLFYIIYLLVLTYSCFILKQEGKGRDIMINYIYFCPLLDIILYNGTPLSSIFALFLTAASHFPNVTTPPCWRPKLRLLRRDFHAI